MLEPLRPLASVRAGTDRGPSCSAASPTQGLSCWPKIPALGCATGCSRFLCLWGILLWGAAQPCQREGGWGQCSTQSESEQDRVGGSRKQCAGLNTFAPGLPRENKLVILFDGLEDVGSPEKEPVVQPESCAWGSEFSLGISGCLAGPGQVSGVSPRGVASCEMQPASSPLPACPEMKNLGLALLPAGAAWLAGFVPAGVP